MKLTPALLTLTAAAALHGLAGAADLLVVPGQSVQAAIDAASPGDRVLVQPGVYTGQIDFSGKAIEVLGLGGAAATTLDGGGAGPVVRFQPGQGTDARLAGFTVTGGFASLGAGGINAGGATPTVEDCIVRGNGGKFGGGISGNPILTRCSILQNSASLTHGGGVYGAPQMTECIVADNTASSAQGGGLYLTGGSASIVDCVIASNRIVFGDPAKGAGVAVHSSAQVLLKGCLIVENVGFGNVFGSYAGGVWATSGTTIEGCTIVGNSASANKAEAGGIWGAAVVRNSIVRDNLPDQLGVDPVVTWSDVAGGAAGIGNFDADPQFADALDSADLHLRATSPCIDAGDPTALDPDGSRADVGAFPFATLYQRSNALESEWTAASWSSISTAVGGVQELSLLLGAAYAGDTYVLLGSLSGTQPGLVLDGLTLPLNPDAYTIGTLTAPAAFGLSGTTGLLDGDGSASCALTLAAGLDPSLAGLTANHAAVVLDFTAFVVSATTDAVAVQLVP
ncbi:right-handed parallel beta-helix repeat-containing protein [Engelhardtia mirabilis]|uniref:Right handed beta helix domain-containing protein n=1 Tax=Engelhardtia mirabilis TaxID=2528011 RepID=A0A518BGT3_9BACT|nr:hypothetical protein Pla133_12640 [Planctomycetes bacterium Pla133]QDV00525.1 hypothetical protein Pla86_12640 [Planctomycetes bacterium Pla86]